MLMRCVNASGWLAAYLLAKRMHRCFMFKLMSRDMLITFYWSE